MRAYSLDLRQRVLAACDAGQSNAAAAETFTVSASWVRRIKQVRRESGRVAPKVQARRGPTPGWETHGAAIRDAVREAPDATLAEYRQRFALPLSKSALDRALAALGLSRKKSPSGRPSRTGRT
jgi:transposase